MMHGAEKTVRRKPFGEGVCLDEGAIDLFRAGRENAVQAYGAWHGGDPFVDGMNELRTDKPSPTRQGTDLFFEKNHAKLNCAAPQTRLPLRVRLRPDCPAR
jgi:hypothetical protein